MTLDDLAYNLGVIMPLNILVIWACALLLIDLFIPKERKGWMAFMSAIGLVVATGFSLAQVGEYRLAFNGMVVLDGFATYLTLLFLGSGLVGIALSYDYLKQQQIERGEYYVLLMFSIAGMVLMSLAADLIVVFLALELLSIPLYVLAGFARPRATSEEAALKYFLLGAFSGGFVVFGVALVFGATGTTALAGIVSAIEAGSANLSLLTVGAALVLIGFGFKVGAVPFHMWTPDVYQGAPSSVTAFMAVGAKAGGFAALLRVFIMAFPALTLDLTPILWMLATLTVVLGNVVAIAQTNIKRLLAYSSIAHAGYILMATVPFGQARVAGDAVASALFYLMAYSLTSFAAWAVVIALEQSAGNPEGEGAGLELSDYAGMGRKYPLLAAVMAVAMLSFIGVPPTLGFIGKFYLFRTVLEGGFVGLALIGVLTSLISAYYYLRVVVVMYMQDGEPVARREPWLIAAAAGSAACVVGLTIFASPLFRWAAEAVLQLM
jgi:NADH-quinone oxidoreductase subunit N